MMQWEAKAQEQMQSSYRVGPGALEELSRHLEPRPERVPVLTDPRVWEHYGDDVRAALAPAELIVMNVAGEREKVVDVVARLLAELAANRVHRRETLVVFGGGVCCDVGGLLAMLYMRGISYVIVATTLMAQLDAAIGGKVGCNAEARKNLVGGFHYADLVLIDPAFLATLPSNHLRAALAEAVKLQVLLPELDITAQLHGALARDAVALTTLAERCVEGKLRLLAEDPLERDLKRPLNLGHAVGHALEGVAGPSLLHGEAVAIGLAATARYAQSVGACDWEHAERIIRLLEELELPVKTHGAAALLRQRLMEIADHRGGSINLVLPAADRGVEIHEECDFGLLADCVQGLPVAREC